MSQNFCNDGRCRLVRAGAERHSVHLGITVQPVENDEVIEESTVEGFDDLIIHQTEERTIQELMISSSIESKANIMLGTVGLIFVILTSVGFTFLIEIFKGSILLLILLIIGLVCLAVSFASSFAIIRPRIRLSLLNPRRANNAFHDMSIEDTKFQIKANLINNLEFIQRQGNHDNFLLTRSYGLFIAGIIIFAMAIFIKSIADLIIS